MATKSPFRRPIRSDRLPKPSAPANRPAINIEVEIEFIGNTFVFGNWNVVTWFVDALGLFYPAPIIQLLPTFSEDFLFAEMILLNGGFYVLCAVWFAFLFLRWNKILFRTERPLWPNLTKTNRIKKDIDETTRKWEFYKAGFKKFDQVIILILKCKKLFNQIVSENVYIFEILTFFIFHVVLTVPLMQVRSLDNQS